MRLVDADALKSKMTVSVLGGHKRIWVCGVIDDAPTIDAQTVKHGQWILHFDDLFPEESTIECSFCHEHSPADMPHDNFCPNCGSYNGGDEK